MAQERNAIKILGHMIHGIKFAMLTTIDELGLLRSRPMATQDTEFDGILWFFTSDKSPKICEVQRNPAVNVAYSDPESNRYVSVSGRAELVRDREKIKSLWKPIYKAWFPEGLDDPALSLLKINVEKAEYWDAPSKALVPILGFAKAFLLGKPYRDAGEHGKVDLPH